MKSDPCDGDEVLVYDSVKVDVVVEPEDEEGGPLVLESVIRGRFVTRHYLLDDSGLRMRSISEAGTSMAP